MMFRKLFYVLVSAVVIGCTTKTVTEVTPATIVPVTRSFNMAVNGIDLPQGVDIIKVENQFILTSRNITKLSFDKAGHLGTLNVDLKTGSSHLTSLFYSLTNYSSHYINLNIISVDEVNQQIKGTLSGNIYHDPLNRNSESKFVSINFDCPYMEVIPVVQNLYNQAKINGIAWDSTNKYITSGAFGDNNNLTEHYVSDNEYEIMVNYNLGSTAVGTYNFTNTTATNTVKFAKYDVSSGTNVNYICSGTLKVVKRTNQFNSSAHAVILYGNYSFTAVNPNDSNDVVQVTDGSFKLLRRY
ncbi:MAG: hypothetical protein CFE24_04200 [Flavobacterium sp. BFFFF2]|nr:MAG: hypothetical protein CFE24_04200 [Flavobacterium sp. BFFFF2]